MPCLLAHSAAARYASFAFCCQSLDTVAPSQSSHCHETRIYRAFMGCASRSRICSWLRLHRKRGARAWFRNRQDAHAGKMQAAVCCPRQDAQTEQGPAAKQRCKAGVLCLVAYMHTYVQGGMDVMMLLTSAFSASSSRVFSSSCDTCRKYRAELGCQCECPPVALCGGQLRATQKQARPNTHGSHSSRSSGLSCVASWWQVGSRHAVTIYPMFTCYH